MSNQHKGNGLPRPSETALGFGFVTPDDRAKWDQARQYQQQDKTPTAAAQFIKSAIAAASEVGSEQNQARVRAAHQVAAQEERDQSKETRRTITHIETVDIQDRDLRHPLDEGFEF